MTNELGVRRCERSWHREIWQKIWLAVEAFGFGEGLSCWVMVILVLDILGWVGLDSWSQRELGRVGLGWVLV